MRMKQLALVIATAYAGSASAQEGASIDVGMFDLFPKLNVTTEHDSNVTRSETNEIESWVMKVAPEVSFVRQYGLNQFEFAYSLENGQYFSSDTDDYTDHFATARLSHEFNSKNRLNAEVNYIDGHDVRGTSFSIGRADDLTSPDTYKNTSSVVTYGYGGLTSTARVDISVGYSTVNYDLNTDEYRSRDRDTLSLTGTFYYSIGAATDLTFDLISNQVDYDFALDAANPLDSDETRALVGIRWESTAKTTGYAKVGYRRKDFDAESRETFNGADWQVGVTWEPTTYSRLDFTTFTNSNETNANGDFINTIVYNVSYDHQWLDRLATEYDATYSTDEYEGEDTANTGGINRKDKTASLYVGAKYDFRRWLVVRAGYTFENRDSNFTGIDFDRNVFSLQVTATL